MADAAAVPHNLDLEAGLIGSALSNNEILDACEGIVSAEDFYSSTHRALWEQILSLRSADCTISPRVLIERVGAAAQDVGGISLAEYIGRAVAGCLPFHAKTEARTIRELADRRRLLSAGTDLIARAQSQDVRPDEVASDAIAAIDAVVQSAGRTSVPRVSLATAAATAIAAAKRVRDGTGMRGIPWGISDFDKMTLGLRPDNFYVIGARPSIGKTTVGLRIAMNVAMRPGAGAVYFSLEAGAQALAFRALASDASRIGTEISYQSIEANCLSEDEWWRVEKAQERFDNAGLEIEQEPQLTLSQIAARTEKARRILEKRGRTLRLVVVDHLLLVRASDRYKGKMVEETTETSAGMKALAKRFSLPVIGLHQVRREVELRQDKRPQLADFKWSGAIEQDADVAIGLHREAYYLQRERQLTNEQLEWLADNQNLMDAEVLKNRDGPTGLLRLYCNIASNVVTGWEAQRV